MFENETQVWAGIRLPSARCNESRISPFSANERFSDAKSGPLELPDGPRASKPRYGPHPRLTPKHFGARWTGKAFRKTSGWNEALLGGCGNPSVCGRATFGLLRHLGFSVGVAVRFVGQGSQKLRRQLVELSGRTGF